jgi:hypothetical protein
MAKVIGVAGAKSADQAIYDPTRGSGSLLLKVALTHFVRKCGLSETAKPSNVFYPIPIKTKFISGILNNGAIEQVISTETVCVHLWRSTYLSVFGPEIPSSGWIAKQIENLTPRPQS